MKILVDADACPVKEIIVKLAKKYKLEVVMFVDTSHILHDDYSKVMVLDKAADSVDFAIANYIKKGDIAVTQDYGLASMLMAKGGNVVHQNGFLYTNENIDRMLFERHLSKEMRRQKKSKGGKIKPRTPENDEHFFICLEKLIIDLLKKEGWLKSTFTFIP